MMSDHLYFATSVIASIYLCYLNKHKSSRYITKSEENAEEIRLSCPYDVVIVGAGPAGSTAAYYLGMQGYRVALVDKKSFPRHKPCGSLS